MAWLRAPLAATAFLTRIPVPAGRLDDADMGRSVAFFPLVGLLLGGVLAGAAHLAAPHAAPGLLAVGLVALLALLTGGLHLDGLADTWDGLGGGKGDRAHMLEIMRDGRSGPHGVAALTLLLLAKVLALQGALGAGDLRALVCFPVVARAAAAVLVVAFPYARAEGLGRAFKGHAGVAELLVAVASAAGILAAAGLPSVLPAAAAAAAALAMALLVLRRAGGLTGDAYGACVEVAEVAFLVAAHGGR